MQDYEKLGLFYLGRPYDLAAHAPQQELVLYESRDLVTHAVSVGMTGSGKTGLCIAMLEPVVVKPKKTDIAVQLVALVWLPVWTMGDGRRVEAWHP